MEEYLIKIKVMRVSEKGIDITTSFDGKQISVELLLAVLNQMAERLKVTALAYVIEKNLSSKDEIMAYYKNLIATDVIDVMPEIENVNDIK